MMPNRLVSPALLLTLAGLLLGARPSSAQPFAYVVGQRDDPTPGNSGIQVVTVVNTATHQKVARIPVGLGCLCVTPESVAVSPDGARVYVTNEQGRSVSVIATATNTVIDTITVGETPAAVDVSPDGSRFFVVSGYPSYVVTVFSTATHALLATIPLNVVQARGIAVAPNGRRLYISTYGNFSVKVVDLDTSSVIATVPAGNLPLGVDITPDGRFVYVGNLLGSSMTVIRTSDNQVVATVPAGQSSGAARVTPSGSRVYVAGFPLTIVSTSSQSVVGTVPGSTGRSLAFTPDGSKLFVAAASLSVFDTATNARLATLAFDTNTEGQAAAVAIAPPPKPDPPTDLHLLGILGNIVTLGWNTPAAGARPTNYLVRGGINPGEVLATLPTGSARPRFSFAAPPGSYYVRVHSVAGVVASEASNEIPIVVNPFVPPSAPTGLTGLVNGSSISLAWRNPINGGAPARLQLEVTGSLSTVIPIGVVERFTYAAVPAGTYTIAVRAVNGYGSSPASNSVTLTFPGACSGAPPTPTDFNASKFGNEIAVEWNPGTTGPAPTGYMVHVAGTIVANVPTTERLASGAVGPGTYHLSVSATNACGASAPTTVQTLTIP